MAESRDEFAKRLLATFKVEAREHVDGLSSGLRKLAEEASPEARREILETIFRGAHSLKGASRAVNRYEMESVCQSLENVLAAVQRETRVPAPSSLAVLQEGVDALAECLFSLETGSEPASARAREFRTRVEAALSGAPPTVSAGAPSSPAAPDTAFGIAETVRIPAKRLEAIFLQAEELISAKLAGRARSRELREILSGFAAWKHEWGKVVPAARANHDREERAPRGEGKAPGALLDFLDWSRSFLGAVEASLAVQAAAAEQDSHALGGMADNLLEETGRALMLPCGRLLDAFPRFVRDLARDQGKDAELVVRGEDMEMDRRILEEMKDPLLHMLRNAVDHGIENPSTRVDRGKPRRGRIELSIQRAAGNHAEILLSDDGTGIDPAMVRAAAAKAGIAAAAEAGDAGDPEILACIFRSGVSTSPIITDISGRGLGLAIVREKVERLGGTVTVSTRPGEGTTFRAAVPLALARFRGVLVRAESRLFVIPTANVLRVARVARDEIRTVERRETVCLDGQAVSLVRLADVLGIPPAAPPGAPGPTVQVVFLGSPQRRIAFAVDEVVSEEELLVKGLGRQLSRVRNVAGVSMRGAAGVVPILFPPDLMDSAVRASAAAPTPPVPARAAEGGAKKSILVVEDSITSRTLLRNILEAAGFRVGTAVDGVDGLTQLRAGSYDLLVSDVDMPRMNGFDLTAKIRADRRLAELPVVLVTALESREDRERGIDVGANAYIVKSQFHRSNLVEVVERLL